LTNIKNVWQQVDVDLHQWIKRSNEKLPDVEEKPHMRKVLPMNLHPKKLVKLEEKGAAAVVPDDNINEITSYGWWFSLWSYNE
jgi:hypothetical protein